VKEPPLSTAQTAKFSSDWDIAGSSSDIGNRRLALKNTERSADLRRTTMDSVQMD